MAPDIRSLSWYQTTVFRAACLAIIIVFGGYVGSLFSMRQALKGLSELAYDEELTTALGEYLDTLKQVDSEQRDRLLSRLRSRTSELHLAAHDPEALRRILDEAGIDALVPVASLTLTPLGEAPRTPDPAWLSRSSLRLGSYLVQLPASTLRQRFDNVQQIKQRYELIQATWDQEIAPSLFLTHLLILLATSALVGTVLLLLVRRYIADAQKVLRGFRHWSERDSSFRLTTDLSGELRVIALQFNAMAEEVAANRRRTLYLEKVASWQTMARKLAHEIKNPLTPIQMMVSQLQRRYKGEDPAFTSLLDDATSIITEEVQALRNMVDHFSRFARLPDPVFVLGDLLSLCQQVIELQRVTYPQHSLSLKTQLASAPFTMDSQLLKQVLHNLIKNAAEASPDRQARIDLVLALDGGRGYRLEVHDDGPGIAPEDLSRIFEAYFTHKHTGPQPGMGLGLAICQKIVLDHQGELTVESRAAHTVFCIRLPMPAPHFGI